MNILFENKELILLDMTGICYYNDIPLLELEAGTYDIIYMHSLFDQCKYISKTLPYHVNCIGLKKFTNYYQIITI